jgi:PAS domain S-box-containing protein
MFQEQSLDWVYKNPKSSFTLRKTPLICWDFYSEQYDRIKTHVFEKSSLLKMSQKMDWSISNDFIQNIPQDTVVVVTNPKLEIIFVTENMLGLNGYKPEEVIGATPKMFQGKDTCVKTSKEIGMAIKAQQPFEKTVLNYCKDGSIYYCHIQGIPVFDKKGNLQNFIALERAA